MRNYEAKIRRNNLFNLSVTEFLLIVAFMMMILVAYFGNEYNRVKDQVAQSFESAINSSAEKVDALSSKLGLPPLPLSDKEALAKLSLIEKRIEEISSFVNESINIKEDWDKLVFIKKTLDSSGASIEELRDVAKTNRDLQYCETGYNKLIKECGVGKPICIGPKWLADITLLESGVLVKPRYQVSGVKEPFEDREYTQQELARVADQYLRYSDSQKIKCRYQIRVYDSTESKLTYKTYLKTIERAFYKLEVDGFPDE
jgi:hypothetical protein